MFQTVQLYKRELQNIKKGEHLSTQKPQEPQQIHVTLLNSINMSFHRVASQFDRGVSIETKSQFDQRQESARSKSK